MEFRLVALRIVRDDTSTNRSVDDVEMRAPANLAGRRGQQRTHRLCRASVASDDLAKILTRNPKLDDGVVITVDLGHIDLVGIFDQCAGDRFDQVMQCHVWDRDVVVVQTRAAITQRGLLGKIERRSAFRRNGRRGLDEPVDGVRKLGTVALPILKASTVKLDRA
jgi:hypothetical protein